MVEGGAKVIASFLSSSANSSWANSLTNAPSASESSHSPSPPRSSSLVDNVVITMSPVLVGGLSAVPRPLGMPFPPSGGGGGGSREAAAGGARGTSSGEGESGRGLAAPAAALYPSLRSHGSFPLGPDTVIFGELASPPLRGGGTPSASSSAAASNALLPPRRSRL